MFENKAFLVLTLCFSLLAGVATAQNQPTFLQGADPKPFGKKWVKIENMSDEFNGSSLDNSKWDNQFSEWKGRAPALFSVNAVSVGGGNLKIVADDNLTQQEINQNPGFTHQGGLVRSRNKTTYGYFETRMKANRTALSSTFWLINQRNDLPNTSCDFRVTELDVTENVGIDAYPNLPNRGWVDQITRTINSNTHSRKAPNGCGVNIDQQGAQTPIGEEAWRDYHVYGVWWKSATELIFFLDGQEAHRITPPEDFDLQMYLRMVVESYDWNKPRAGFDNMNLSLDQRTTYYAWTRSWKLEDDPNAGGGNTVDVNCNSLPSSLTTSTSIPVSVNYTADQNRDVVIELWNSSTNSYLASGRTTVSSGSGTANITINIGTPPATGSNYQLKASIRPVGANWQQNIDACNKNGISLTSGGGTPDVDCASLPSSLVSSNSMDISIAYTADQNRDVVIELWNSATNSYLGAGRKTVAAGSGTTSITVGLNAAPAVGGNYQLKASIRPVGAGWQQNIDACNKNGVTLTSSGGNVVANIPGRVDAEDYNSGGQGVAYNDSDASNNGGQGRTNEGVDVENTGDAGGGLNVGWMNAGEWIEYTCNVTQAGSYDVYLRVASPNGNGRLALLVDGNALTGTVNVPNTGGWQNYQTVRIRNKFLSAGNHVFRLNVIASGVNINFWSAWAAQSAQTSSGVQTSVGVSDQAFQMYPNPLGSGDLSFDFSPGKTTVRIFDLQGRKIYQQVAKDGHLQVENHVFPGTGMYYVQLQGEHRTVTRRLVKR